MAFRQCQIYVAAQSGGWLRATGAWLEARLETERERLPLFLPVALMCGIGAWFALPTRWGWIGWVAACCLLALIAQMTPAGGRLRRAVTIAALTAAGGLILIWGKAMLAGAPPLARPLFTLTDGRVTAVEPLAAKGYARLTITPASSSGLPRRIRINVADADMPADVGEGAVVRFRVRLMPPAGPMVPGGYDFARRAYFDGIGATGRALPPLLVLRPAPAGASPLRHRLADHVRSRLAEREGAIAAALATGETGAIAQDDAEAMRRSGLAHLLSISGLHVSAVILTVMLLVARLLALSRRVAMRWPVWLIAAGVGALAGLGYTLLTGAEIPTVRSCIAALLVLAALAAGREAISLRLVATGALIVLVLWPESLVGPSFQMSFLAVAVLVAVAQSRRFQAWTHAREEGAVRRHGRFLLGLFLTGLAIELALLPIGLMHFHKAGLLGAVANMVAIPLTTFIVIPVEALALALDFTGISAPLWWVVEQALSLLLWIAHVIGDEGHGVLTVATMPGAIFLCAIAGLLWLLLWRTDWRWLGLAPMAASLALGLAWPAPDMLVSGDGRHLVIRERDGTLALLRGGAGDYVRGVMSELAGQGLDDGAAMPALADRPYARCSRDLCRATMSGDGRSWELLATRSAMFLP